MSLSCSEYYEWPLTNQPLQSHPCDSMLPHIVIYFHPFAIILICSYLTLHWLRKNCRNLYHHLTICGKSDLNRCKHVAESFKNKELIPPFWSLSFKIPLRVVMMWSPWGKIICHLLIFTITQSSISHCSQEFPKNTMRWIKSKKC